MTSSPWQAQARGGGSPSSLLPGPTATRKTLARPVLAELNPPASRSTWGNTKKAQRPLDHPRSLAERIVTECDLAFTRDFPQRTHPLFLRTLIASRFKWDPDREAV